MFKSEYHANFYHICRALNVSKTYVSDLGIKFLCGNAYNEIDVGGCKLLESLFVRNSNVTEDGIRTAMIHLTNLKYLDHELPLPIIENNERIIQRPPGYLQSLSCSANGSVVVMCTIPLALNVLSSKRAADNFVEDNNLINIRDVKDDFHALPLFNLFRRFIIRFDQGVVSYLTRFGAPLQSLELQFLENVNVSFICSTCPRLLKLTLFHNISYRPLPPPVHRHCGSSNNPEPIFPIIANHLEYFEFSANLQYRESGNLPELAMILMSPNLKSIFIEKCFFLVDRMILDAFENHRFEKLESLTLIHCNRLSKEAFVDVFLSHSNSLKQLRLLFCEQLCNTSNRDEWLLLAQQRNWVFSMQINI